MELKAEKQGAHSDSVYSVAFSPDGTTIVSGSSEHSIKVWDAGVGTDTLQPLTPDLTVLVLAAASLELKAETQSAHRKVKSVAFSPDGETIVSGSTTEVWDGSTIEVWDAGSTIEVWDGSTIEVWDAGASAPTPSNP